jgi:hypothetical protein
MDSRGEKIRDVQFDSETNTVGFETRAGEFAYRIE